MPNPYCDNGFRRYRQKHPCFGDEETGTPAQTWEITDAVELVNFSCIFYAMSCFVEI